MFEDESLVARCCLIPPGNFVGTRIVSLLERRFDRRLSRISFDWKTFDAIKPSRKAKVSRSLLKIQPKLCSNEDHAAVLPFSSSSEDELDDDINETSTCNDDYLDRLAAWIPSSPVRPIDDESENEEIVLSVEPILTVETPVEENEDPQVTFVQLKVKNETIPQLDGQTDFSSNQRRRRTTPLIHSLIPRRSPPRRRKRSESFSPNKSKRKKISSNTRTLDKYFHRKRSANYFENCISIDDSDPEEISEIARPTSFLSAETVRSHQRILCETINTSPMRIKWLKKLENVLIEEIFLGEENGRVQLDAPFVVLVVTNFLQLFIVRHGDHEDDELAFYQSPWTCFLPYFLRRPDAIVDERNELPAFVDRLFDLLCDLIDLDLCERDLENRCRSTWILNDYFHRQIASKSFGRVKILLYLIESLVAHGKGSPQDDEQIFQSLEDALRCVVKKENSTSRNERISICLSAIELLFLIAPNKSQRLAQIVRLLLDIAEENAEILPNFLLDENFLVDLRLLFLNEFIARRFHSPLKSIDDLERFFSQLDLNDELNFLLVRSLFSSYADLLIETQSNFFNNTIQSAQLTMFLRDSFDLLTTKLNECSSSNGPMRIFFRLLKFKWKQFH